MQGRRQHRDRPGHLAEAEILDDHLAEHGQRAHLRRVARAGLTGHEAVSVLKALVFADLAFLREGKRSEKSLEQSLGRLAAG